MLKIEHIGPNVYDTNVYWNGERVGFIQHIIFNADIDNPTASIRIRLLGPSVLTQIMEMDEHLKACRDRQARQVEEMRTAGIDVEVLQFTDIVSQRD